MRAVRTAQINLFWADINSFNFLHFRSVNVAVPIRERSIRSLSLFVPWTLCTICSIRVPGPFPFSTNCDFFTTRNGQKRPRNILERFPLLVPNLARRFLNVCMNLECTFKVPFWDRLQTVINVHANSQGRSTPRNS